MSDVQKASPQELPPHAQLIQMGAASWVSAALYATAKLGLADHLADGAGEGFACDQGGRSGAEKMDPLHDRIGLEHEIAARRRDESSNVVKQPEGSGMFRQRAKIARNPTLFAGKA